MKKSVQIKQGTPKEIDGSNADTKDQTSGSYDNENSHNVNDFVKELIKINPYYLQDTNTGELVAPVDGKKKVGRPRKRDQRNTFIQAYGLMPAKDPHLLRPSGQLITPRPAKYGNYRDIKLLSYDDRIDPPL